MTLLRGHLRAWTLAWLVCQVASLSALLPPGCCPAHGDAVAGSECHRITGAVDAAACPMHAAAGEVCPMHASGTEDAPIDDGEAPCVMRGLCEGPSVALGALLTVPGMLPDVATADMTATLSPVPRVDDCLLDRPSIFEPPPPRV